MRKACLYGGSCKSSYAGLYRQVVQRANRGSTQQSLKKLAHWKQKGINNEKGHHWMT
jgi:hypothetical protein